LAVDGQLRVPSGSIVGMYRRLACSVMVAQNSIARADADTNLHNMQFITG
jgi:hypothetical protein